MLHYLSSVVLYWGLRDYQTGSWEGGDDPSCDHSQGRGGQGPQSKNPNADYPAFAAHRGGNPDECPRCGAQRIDQQLGLEATPQQYVARMVEVFREVRRVLADHGSVWCNLGDSYASGTGRGYPRDYMDGGAVVAEGMMNDTPRFDIKSCGLKPKDLVGIPWRVAFALQEDGWYLRSDIIWAKANPLPESVTDRPTKSHEYIFLLTKNPKYYFDQEAVRENYKGNFESRYGRAGAYQNRAIYGEGDGTTPTSLRGSVGYPPPQMETLDGSAGEAPRGPDGRRITHVEGKEGSLQHRSGERWPGLRRSGNLERKHGEDVGVPGARAGDLGRSIPWEETPGGGRNIRTVWEINTEPYSEAHFATFPQKLVTKALLAGCPERVCQTCGKPSERIVDVTYRNDSTVSGRPAEGNHRHDEDMVEKFSSGVRTRKHVTTEGWTDCGHDNWRSGVVLDPFMGSGTTALVARKHGRHAIGIELNESYCALATRRLQQLSLFSDYEVRA